MLDGENSNCWATMSNVCVAGASSSGPSFSASSSLTPTSASSASPTTTVSSTSLLGSTGTSNESQDVLTVLLVVSSAVELVVVEVQPAPRADNVVRPSPK